MSAQPAPYDFRTLEAYWQNRWQEEGTFRVPQDRARPKSYVLDMFPYPSGAGLHVGHPLGYIATDIVARYRRNRGHNVLHPMGYDAFGLPAEQYAIQRGVHPAVSTEQNIQTFKKQLSKIGLFHNPDAEFRTSDPEYYQWTQWVFLRLFNSWYDQAADKARPIAELEEIFKSTGNAGLNAATDQAETFTAEAWNALSRAEQLRILLRYRLAYQAETLVNWCPALGTVLANDEVKDGLSERGGHPVERRPMRQWSLRITAYAERLLSGLERVDWPKSVVEMQRNWVGKSRGAMVSFKIANHNKEITVFTTRPDTIFGSTFLVVAPEHSIVEFAIETLSQDQKGQETLLFQKQADVMAKLTARGDAFSIQEYVSLAKNRSERDRLADTKNVSGSELPIRVIHPFSGELLPVWVSDYVLAGYGTGAIMAVPAHDSRDHAFARHFNLPIVEVVQGGADVQQEAFESKDESAKLVNSDFLNGLAVPQAIDKAIEELEKKGIGRGTTQYRLRDAIFSRQRYWGAPIPIQYAPGSNIPEAVPESELPVLLPETTNFNPTGTGASPLAAIETFLNKGNGWTREVDTMPGWACSSWYFFRYPDAHNASAFADKSKTDYWLPVDLYLGGAEHAVGHLLYARFWSKVLYDLGYVSTDEPFAKLVNQGMIQGTSALAYRHKQTGKYVSLSLIPKGELENYTPIHVDVNLVEAGVLNVAKVREWLPEFTQAEFVTDAEGKFTVGSQVEKMSKRYHNVVNPDDICAQYGADTFRMYEMFLGPLEMHKPWNTDGITGVHGFLKRFWAHIVGADGNLMLTEDAPSRAELKVLHQTIKKVQEDIEGLSFNTSVAQFMICLNELQKLESRKRAIFEPLLVVLSPYAPHITEELWHRLGHNTPILDASWPELNPDYLVAATVTYPLQVNGKVRAQLELPAGLDAKGIEEAVLGGDELQRWLEGKSVQKVIVVPGRIVNVVAR